MYNATHTDFETQKNVAVNPKQTGLERLLAVMRCLRHPLQGCPWDLQQTPASLTPYTIEKAYEVAAAIAEADAEAIQSELGDLLFQVIFYAQLAQEQGDFSFDEIASTTAEKLIRRHPHVFADQKVNSVAEVKDNWERIKQQEREAKQARASVFADVPGNLPAVLRALKIQKRCANVGFDWHSSADVLAKVEEETVEVREALAEFECCQKNSQPEHKQQAHVEEEIGDLLFAVVNLARHAKVNPETALQKANAKFMRRFEYVEEVVKRQQGSFANYSLEQLEKFWREAKEATKSD